MIRILHVLKRYSSNYPLLNEMVRLDSNKFQSFVYYLEGRSDGRNEIEGLARDVFYDSSKPHGRIYSATKKAHSLSKIIDKNEVDIINCHLEKTMPIGVLASMLSKRKPKIVTTVHGLEGLEGDAEYDLRKKIKNYFFYRFLDKVICVSNSIKSDVIKNSIGNISDKVGSVQNGLVFDRFSSVISKEEAKQKILPSSKSELFWFGTVGRLAKVKNHKNMIAAFRSVVDKNPRCLLLLVGDGPLREELSTWVDALKLTENVLFLGKRGDVPDILKALDVFLFPSYREGLPLAMLEAMASGLPVIASDIPVVREVLGDENVGGLVDPDDPSAMANVMLTLLELSREELKHMGERAKARAVNNFSADRMVRNYETLYEQIYNHESG